jgi:hypothetical protein
MVTGMGGGMGGEGRAMAQEANALKWQHRRHTARWTTEEPGRPRPRGMEGQPRAPHGPEEKPNGGGADRAAELRGVHWLGKRRRDSGTPSKDRRGRAGGVIMI